MTGTFKFEIKHRFTDRVLFTAGLDAKYEREPRSIQIGAAVKIARQRGANLREANLWGADLREANLREANLWGADLWEANLRGANLREANLREANLWGANLWGANLREANLREANLWGANLREANLREANLWEANLWGADLRGANGIAGRVIDGGLRSDGYRFLLTRTDPGAWRVKAGCRNFTLTEAREHWGRRLPRRDARRGNAPHSRSHGSARETPRVAGDGRGRSP